MLKFQACVVLYFSALFAHGQLPYNHLFDDTKVSSVFIIMSPDSLDDMYEHFMNGHEYTATFIFNDGISSDTVETIGIRFRGNTSLGAEKKSFKISFNTYAEGREYSGVKKMNLNGSHNDPSMVREKFYFDTYNAFGLPERRSSFVRLYINGDYYGLYTNLEEMDEIFLRDRFGDNSGNLYKCTWPSDLTWHGSGQSYYENGPYDLQTNEQQNNYSDLIHFIDVLNNTSDENFQCEIEKVLNVQNFLKIYALDIAAGHWDNYGFNNNNYFLYHNQLTGRFEFLSYDCDNTFGVDWFGIDWAARGVYNWQSDNKPLVDRLMAIDEYRDQFSWYMNALIDGPLAEENVNPLLDDYRDLIDEAALEDLYRTYDYGYSYDDFINSFDTDDIDSHTPYGIKNFVVARNENTAEELELNSIFPVVTESWHTPGIPAYNQPVQFTVSVFDDNVVSEVVLNFMMDGLFDAFPLYDDGMHGDSLANDNVFGLEFHGTGDEGDFFYHFTITDNEGKSRNYPYCGDYILHVGYHPPGLVVNECMAINTTVIADESGDFDDYIEIYNTSTTGIFLGDKFLSDEADKPTKWRMPDTLLPADGYLLVWADDEWEEGTHHSSFKLDGDKDEVYLFDNADHLFSLIDSVSFVNQVEDTSIGRLPNGTGPFTVLPVASPGGNNEIEAPVFDPGVNDIIVLGNPASGWLQFNLLITGQAVTSVVNLYDLSGRLIAPIVDSDFNSGTYTYSVAVDQLARGMYLMDAEINGEKHIVKVAVF